MNAWFALWVMAAVLVPLLYPLVCVTDRFPAGRRWLLPLLPLPALTLALTGEPGWSLELPWLLTGGLWQLDELRRTFLLLTGLLWFAAGVYATGYLRESESRRFGIFWGLTLAGNLGLVLAADVAGFYSFFTLMTLAGYGLVVHSGDGEAFRAGRVYLVMAILGEMAILTGLLLAAAEAGSLILADLPAAIAASGYRNGLLALILAGFGVKAGLPFLHMWLPLAHPVAPAPASAVLSGAMIKAGLLGWLLLLPLGDVALPGWGLLLVVAGALASIGGAAIGLCQQTPKAVLAYSSISQMGLMTLMVGAALGDPARAFMLVPLIVLYALHHGLAKGSLFLATGLSRPAAGPGRWLLWSLIVLPGLALAGLPLTSGAAVKLAMKTALAPEALAFAQSAWLGPLMSAGAVATLLLMIRTFWLLQSRMKTGETSGLRLAGWLLATGFSLLLIWFLPWELPVKGQPDWWPEAYDWWALLYPMLLATGLTLLAWQLGVSAPPVPPGDLVVILERALGSFRGFRDKAAVRSPSVPAGHPPWFRRMAGPPPALEELARTRLALLFVMVLLGAVWLL